MLHVEFLKVNLKEKMKTFVPVSIEGESPAVKDGLGTLLTILQEVEIEALPNDIPESVAVDVSTLTEVEAEKTVKDMIVPAGVTIISDPDETVVKIGALAVQEAPAETASEAEAAPTTETPESEQAPVDN
jgi:large subunit ribosomal protein L25